MATATINWAPDSGFDSQDQGVYFKTMQASDWTLFSTVDATTNTAVINGLSDNVIYQFRITNNCVFGYEANSDIVETINMTCPAVTLDPTIDTVDFSFSHSGGDISRYTVDLLNASDAVIASSDFPSPGATVSGTFSGLTPVTTYKVRVTVFAAGVYVPSFSKVCTPDPITTDAVVCNAASGLTVGMS
jgi:hypothetical protein